MKDLKNILNEGVLDDIEKTLSNDDIANMYPPPGNKEWFKVSYDNSMWIVWECPQLIRPLLARIPNVGDRFFKPEDCIGISAKVGNDKELSLFLATDWSHCGTSLKAYTQYLNSKPEAKKMALAVFKHLSKNYSALEKVLTISAQKRKEMDCYGMVNCIDFKEVLKY